MRRILIFAVFFLVLISSNSVLADNWWNESWNFRLPMDINSSVQRENVSITTEINFTEILENNNISGTFDSNSIRVLENNYSSPYDWENTSIGAGNLTWIANGTVNSTNRRFWIYFDILENGAKNQGELIKDEPHWRSGYTDNMNVWSNQSASPGIGYTWNRTWAESMDIFWKWSTGTDGLDTSYLYVDGVEQRNKKNSKGNETIFLTGSTLVGRFYSSPIVNDPVTDEYGTYGCAVEWIKFYPVSNYTNATINESLGSLDEKDMKINLMEPSNGSTQYYGDNITIRVNITNYFDTPLTNANVNFTIKHNDTYSYQCSGIEEGNGYYNCSWDSSSGVLGNYSIEVNASKQYYNSNSTIWNNRFNLVKKNIKKNLIK